MKPLQMGPNDKQLEVPLPILFGKTSMMASVRRTLESLGNTAVPLLIQGESGTGKELFVHFVQSFASPNTSLVKVVCPAIPHALLESELFGYEKGAFTGASSTKRGRIEEANGGTLLLDDVGSLDVGMQSKLLQALQDGTFTRVGALENKNIDFRLICTTNRDLREQVAEGSFRLDFLYRINAVTVNLLPLRQRMEDLPELVDFFLQKHSAAFQHDAKPISRSMMAQMRRYTWPGNMRQLENLVLRWILVGDEEVVMAEFLQDDRLSDQIIPDFDLSEPTSLKEVTRNATHELERQIILKVLRANSWNRQRTAKWLKMSYRSLLYKLNDLGRGDAPRVRRSREEIDQAENPGGPDLDGPLL